MNSLQPPNDWQYYHGKTVRAPGDAQSNTEYVAFHGDDLVNIFNNLTVSMLNLAGSNPEHYRYMRLVFQPTRARLMITNQTASPVFGCIYLIRPRRDTNTTPKDTMDIYFSQQPSRSGTVIRNANDINATPYRCSELTSRYKVVRQMPLKLEAGQSVIKHFTFKSRTINGNNVLGRIIANPPMPPGKLAAFYAQHTTFCLFQVWGSQALQEDAGPGNPRAPVYGPHCVTSDWQVDYAWKNLVNNVPNRNYQVIDRLVGPYSMMTNAGQPAAVLHL